MTTSHDQPLTRRALREARARGASGAQPVVSATGPAPEPFDPDSSQPVTGMIDLDGRPLTRRRLRELRAAGVSATALVAPANPSESPVVPSPAVTVAPPIDAPPSISAAPLASGSDASAFAPPQPNPTAPQGHWTRQMVEGDDPTETTVSRQVGAGAPTTNALVLPEVPPVLDLGGPLNSTGEILLTGSVPLSQSLSTTGAVDRLDGAELDDRFDDRSLAETAADAAPVRAIAASSAHPLGTPIVANGKPRGNRALTALLVSASVLAVVVTGLVVAAIVLGWF